MEEEEDWDAPTTPATKPTVTPTITTSTSTVPQQSSSNTTTDNAQQTLKITDGYKYSYEALASPANVEDWVDPPTYGSSKRILNGFSQNSFRDNNKPYRSERSDRSEKSDNYKRFDKRNNSYSNPSGDFVTPKPPRYSRPVPNVNPSDWDAPINDIPPPMNGSWNDNVHVPITNPVEDDWDAPGGGTPQSITNHKSTPVPIFNPPVTAKTIASNNVEEEEDWDAPAGSSSKADVLPPVELPTYRPSSAASVSMHSVRNEPLIATPIQPVDEESWDEPGTPQSVSQVILPTFKPPITSLPEKNDEDWDVEPSSAANTDNVYPKNIPSFSSRNSDGPYSNNQRYDDNWQSNKYQRSRNFDSNDHFSRDPFSRHSRGNFRNNSYDRGSRGSRGNRGGRGGRGGRDFNSSFGSRDNSRNRGDREDKSYRNNDRPHQPPVSFNNTLVQNEEDWDSPTGFAIKHTEKSGPPPIPVIPPIIPSQPVVEEESWD